MAKAETMSDDEDEAATEIFPIDVSALRKGDILAQEQCERAIGITASHARYRLELLRLREYIMHETEARRCPLSVAILGNSLRINTDAEASGYHAKLVKQGERAIFRNGHRLHTTVSIGALDQDNRREHERRCALVTQKIMRLKSVRMVEDGTRRIASGTRMATPPPPLVPPQPPGREVA